MKVYNFGEKINNKINLCLGYFDSVHKGHRELFSLGKASGTDLAVFTFDDEISVGSKKQGVVFTIKERLEIFESLGVGIVIVASFQKIKDISAEDFVDILKDKYEIEKIICGEDYKFGKNGTGDIDLLKNHYNNSVEIAKEIEYNGEKASSKTAKELIERGDIESLNTLLAGEYFISGYVEKGFQNGTKLGFPTANIKPAKEKIRLFEGVYIGSTKIKNKIYKSMINVGSIPTFGIDEYKIETHAIGITEPLYGEQITVYFERFLRASVKFSSVEELKKQLEKDVKEIR